MDNPDLASLFNSLSGEDIAALKNVATSLFSGDASRKEEPQKKDAESSLASLLSGFDMSKSGLPDMSKLASLAPILTEISKKDERTEFILALKPFLSEARRPKADEAAKLIKLVNILPMLRDRGIL